MQVKTKEKNSDRESDGDAKSGVEIGGVCRSNLGTQGAEVTKCASGQSVSLLEPPPFNVFKCLLTIYFAPLFF